MMRRKLHPLASARSKSEFTAEMCLSIPPLLTQRYVEQDLDLRNNLLTNLTDLSRLQKLQTLKLTDNMLVSLPDSLFKLSSLQVLWMDVNKLTHLPPGIGRLTHLEHLKLDDNQIVHLPQEIGQLEALQVLQADAAGLTSLPATIGNCRSLVGLYLDDNRLTRLPDITSLTNLELIRASNNSITFLDDSFVEGLLNVDTIELRYNGLKRLPISIGHLPKLKNLEVSHNELQDLPVLYHAQELRYLHLSHNNIHEFAQSKLWRTLTSLRELHINHNQLGPRLPDEMDHCVNLTSLFANNNQLTSLPDTMHSLLELRQLQVQNNDLTALPSWTGSLPKLQVLDATNNSISQLPTIGNSMRHLYLYQNPINATSRHTQEMLRAAEGLSTFDITASSASRYIWETVPGFDRCGPEAEQLRDAEGRVACVPRIVKPRHCRIDDQCQFTVSFIDEFNVRSRIGGLHNITVMPMETGSTRSVANATSIWPILLQDNRDGDYTATIPADEMLAKGMHRFQLFKDGYEFWAPQTPEGDTLCDLDDTPPYPHCPVELDFQARHCGPGSHPDAINGTVCLCDAVAGVPLVRTSEDTCAKICDSETSVASADRLHCECKDGFYDTSKVGLVVCFEDRFNGQRASRARSRQARAADAQCLKCPPCLDCSRNSSATEMIGVPYVKARHRMNFSTHQQEDWSLLSLNAASEKYVYDCAGETAREKTDEGGEVREEICPLFLLSTPSNITCKRDHVGPLCDSCAETYRLDHSGKCVQCDSARNLWWLLALSLAFVAIVPVLFGLAQTMHLDEKLYEWLQAKLNAKLGKSAEKLDVKETAKVAKDIRNLSHFFETTKITISFGQVASLLPGVLGLEDFNFKGFDFKLPGFGLDLRGTLECFIFRIEENAEARSGETTPAQIYFDAWLLHVIGLPLLMFLPVAVFMLYSAMRHRCRRATAGQDGDGQAAATGGADEEISAKLRAHIFFCIYLLYPSQTEAIFRLFECRKLGCEDHTNTGKKTAF